MEKNEKLVAETRIAEYSPTAAGLAEIRSRLQGIVYDVTDKKQMEAAKRDRRELVQLRTGLEAKRKELKAPALERSRLIDAEAKDIEAQIRALEEPIDIQIKAEEARVESERLAKLEAERVRVETIMATINRFREFPNTMTNWPSGRINAELHNAMQRPITAEEFEEYTDQAADALAACILRLQTLLAEAKAREEAADRARQAEIELAAMRERNAQLEREAEEARQREAQRIRDAEEAVERERKAEEERVRREAEAVERHAREAKRAAQEEAQRIERERIEAQAAADREEARKEAEKAKQAAAEAKAAHLRSIGLQEAVQAALQWFEDNEIVEMAEQMRAALDNAKKESMA